MAVYYLLEILLKPKTILLASLLKIAKRHKLPSVQLMSWIREADHIQAEVTVVCRL